MKLLSKVKVGNFLERLEKEYEVFDTTGDVLPPKQYFFPPEETTFTASINDDSVTTPDQPGKFVLFGLTLKALEAITFLDEIMSNPDRDYYYFRRRRRAVLIGVTAEPFEVGPGGDVIFSDLGKEYYRVQAITATGQEIVQKYLPDIKRGRKRASMKEPEKTMVRLRKLFLDSALLKEAVEWSWKGYPKIWEQLGRECLGCGICTYVCPMCHCFSVEDSVDLSGERATRCRRWDACTLPVFAKVAGGVSFHRTIKERYYNWHYHKFVRSFLEFGRAQCVACGKCSSNCPARIDIENVLVDIVTRYKKQRCKV